MKKARFIQISLVLILIICCIASADDKTVNRNGDESSKQKDGIAQLITYQAEHKPIKEILAELSEMTGVTLRAGLSSKDWQVRDRKMNIFVEDMSLSNLMNSIARVMKFKWAKGGTEEKPSFRLYMDRKTILSADSEAYRMEQRFKKEVLSRRENLVKTVLEMDENLDPMQEEQLRQDNPYLYGMYKRGSLAFFKALFTEVPEAAQAVAGCEKNMVFSASKLSPEAQQLMLEATRAKWDLKGYRWTSNGEAFPEEHAADLDVATLGMETIPHEFSSWGADASRHLWDFGGIGVYLGERYCHIDFFRDLNSDLTRYNSNTELTALENDCSLGKVYNDTRADREIATLAQEKELEEYFPYESPVEHPDEPGLHVKIKMKTYEWSLAGVLHSLHEASKLSVISDSFKTSWGHAAFGDEEQELKDVLEKISDGFRCDWEKHDNRIEIRHKEWFKKRTCQIPDEWVETWRSRFEKRGYISLEDYAQMAALTSEQINENLANDEVFGRCDMYSWEFIDNRNLLRLYARLNTRQRKAIFSDLGLDLGTVTLDQWKAVEQLFKFNTEIFNDPNIRVLLFGEYVSEGPSGIACKFKACTTDGSFSQEWFSSLPKYPIPKVKIQKQEAKELSDVKK